MAAALPVLPFSADRLGCMHCGQEHRAVSRPEGRELRCVRCDLLLQPKVRAGDTALLAVSLAGLIALIPALLLPVLVTSKWGSRFEGSVWQMVLSFIEHGENAVGALIAICALVAPVVFLVAAAFSTAPISGRGSDAGRAARRLAIALGEWAMLEVFLLGLAICFTKLDTVARVQVEPALLFLAIVAVCVIFARQLLADPQPVLAQPADAGAIGCPHCLAHAALPRNGALPARCPGCNGVLDLPHHDVGRAWALWFAALCLVVPANVVPVMETNSANGLRVDTIFSGVVLLFREGDWGIGLIVFVASIVVPVLKLTGLAVILWRTGHPAPLEWRPRLVRLHHALTTIGRWSMLDVFIIGFLATVVRFGFGGMIVPLPGVLAFAGVVVLTMLAANSVDPRALWPVREPISQPA